MDWSRCPDVERKPDVLSGAWVVRGTRVPPNAILDHVADGYTPQEIVRDIFPSLRVNRTTMIVAFARSHAPHPA